MADLLETPQYALPFRLGLDGAPVCHEQDSAEDVMQNGVVALRYRQGDRTADPNYGIPDLAFQQGGADLETIVRTVSKYEPDITVDAVREILDGDGVDNIRIDLGVDNG